MAADHAEKISDENKLSSALVLIDEFQEDDGKQGVDKGVEAEDEPVAGDIGFGFFIVRYLACLGRAGHDLVADLLLAEIVDYFADGGAG